MPQIVGELNQKEFINLFGYFLRMRNLLITFDDFKGKEIISERDWQDYLGKYQDITDDVVFETELIKQVEVNIDYILVCANKYCKSNREDKDLLVAIQKAVAASPELRSKKELIISFIDSLNNIEDVNINDEWQEYTKQQKEQELESIIKSENLKPEETKEFMERSLRDDELKTIGTDIDKIMPPISRFGGGRDKKKKILIDKLMAYFEKFRHLL